jgi:hypothetical protein
MGTLGRHKRRRRNTSQHECMNTSGRSRTLQQDAGDSSLETSLEPQEYCSVDEQQEGQESVATIAEAPTHTRFTTKPLSLVMGPKNGTTDSISKSTTRTEPPRQKPTASTSTQEKVIAEFSEEDLLGFLALLRQQKNTKTASTNDGRTTTTTDSTEQCFQPALHSNNQYISFEKLTEFTLDFDSFSYKVNEFGRTTKRDSRDAIRQAESRATKK